MHGADELEHETALNRSINKPHNRSPDYGFIPRNGSRYEDDEPNWVVLMNGLGIHEKKTPPKRLLTNQFTISNQTLRRVCISLVIYRRYNERYNKSEKFAPRLYMSNHLLMMQ